MKRLYAKRLLVSILTAVLVFNCVMVKPMQTKAVGTTLAGLTIWEILSIIGLTVAGGVLTYEVAQGNEFTLPGSEEAQRIIDQIKANSMVAGVAVDRMVEQISNAQAGDTVYMSQEDFDTLRAYYAQHDFDYSVADTIQGANFQQIVSSLEGFSGHSLPQDSTNMTILQNFLTTGGQYVAYYAFNELYNSWRLIISNGTPAFEEIQGARPPRDSDLRISGNLLIYNGYGSWIYANQTAVVKANMSTYAINSAIVSSQLQDIKSLLQQGNYDVLTRGRYWNDTDELTGNIAITVPWANTWRSALAEQLLGTRSIADLYPLINVYPVNTLSDTLAGTLTGLDARSFSIPLTSAFSWAGANDLVTETQSYYSMDLRNFFPFCIPFDVVDFCRQFQATPQAPSITFPFPYMTDGGGVAFIEKTFDLSQFDAVAQLVRRLELVAFIVGLAFVTRNFFIRG